MDGADHQIRAPRDENQFASEIKSKSTVSSFSALYDTHFGQHQKFWQLGSGFGPNRGLEPLLSVSGDRFGDKQRVSVIKGAFGLDCGASRSLSQLRPGRFRQRRVEGHQC
jgi:hypothetical protein